MSKKYLSCHHLDQVSLRSPLHHVSIRRAAMRTPALGSGPSAQQNVSQTVGGAPKVTVFFKWFWYICINIYIYIWIYTYVYNIYTYVYNIYIICKCIKRRVFMVFQIRVVYGHVNLDLLVTQHSFYIKSSGDSEPAGQGKYLFECDTSHYVYKCQSLQTHDRFNMTKTHKSIINLEKPSYTNNMEMA